MPLLLTLCSAQDSSSTPASLPEPTAHHVDFAREIKPLLEASCVQCHGRGKDKGGLSLETRESFLRGGDTGAAALPGDSSHSLIVRLVSGVDPENQMPKKGKKWTPQQVGLLRAWIDQGVPWDKSITFARPEPENLRVRRPGVAVAAGANPVDAILATYFMNNGVAAREVVPDEVFARRAYLDAIGLLPTGQQLDAFLADSRPDKREQLVRALLADRRGYADHWLTFWNDLLRNDYRGTGFIDGGRRQISGWLYAALLNDEPYDQFVAHLIDPDKTSEGFARGIIWRGTVNASQLPPMQAAQNISQVFMGVNLKCASCHDSFVNDWTLADAYGLAAVYADGPLELVHCDKPTDKTAGPRFIYPQIGTIDPKLERRERLARLAQIVTGKADGRLSRTIVNRLWQRLLGRGLVEPVDDMDRAAWSPELLDGLAEDLVTHQCDLKRSIEVILTSRAYQMASFEPPADQKQYVFRGPLPRRLTAEQFCDAISSFSDDWSRLPATLDVDWSTGGIARQITEPKWIWTDQPVTDAQARADAQHEEQEAQAKRKAEQQAKPDAKVQPPKDPRADTATKKSDGTADDADDDDDDDDDPASKKKDPQAEKPEYLPRHRVVFRKSFELAAVPDEAFAAAAASQSFSIYVNGKILRPRLSDGERRGRINLYDLGGRLVAGTNSIAIDVSSHTEKSLNEAEKLQYPASRNHLNKVSGVGCYLRMIDKVGGNTSEIFTDDSWRVFRAPDGREWRGRDYIDGEWPSAIELPPGAVPVDEGPGLPPITRNDFANEPIDFARPMRNAVSTTAQPGCIRASLLGADALMTALDRPNREQVMTVRSSVATTIQAVELAHGNSLDERLKRAATRLLPAARKGRTAWVKSTYRHALARDPNEGELEIAAEMLGTEPTEQSVADFLWAVSMLPEFQLIR